MFIETMKKALVEIIFNNSSMSGWTESVGFTALTDFKNQFAFFLLLKVKAQCRPAVFKVMAKLSFVLLDSSV